MSPEQLAHERRRGRFAAAGAIASALTFAGGGLWYQSVNADSPDGDNESAVLRYFELHADEYLASSILQAVGMLLLIAVTAHLYRATKARRPEEPGVVLVMGVYGPLGFALSTLVRAITLAVLADDFAGRQFQRESEAEDLFGSPALVISTVLGFSGVLALGYWLVKGSLDAMRVGLLTRFMGILGIALGPALVLGFGSLLLPLWLLALGALYSGWWPQGVPPAWRTGKAQPWQPRTERKPSPDAPASESGGERDGEVEAVGPGVREADRPQGGRRRRRR
jgi:hypothetical protein